MRIFVNGIGAVGAFGSGKEALAGAAAEMKTRESYEAKIEGLDRFLTASSQRRMDSMAKMATLASCLALEDAEFKAADNTRVGVMIASGYGCQRASFAFKDSFIEYGDMGASPTHFAASVHNALASQISISQKLKGPTLTLSCFGQSAPQVIKTCRYWLENGMADQVLAGFGDENSEVRDYALKVSGCEKKGSGEGFVSLLLGGERSENSYAAIECLESGRGEISGASLERVSELYVSGRGIEGKDCVDHSAVYGAMPVSDAFDMALAALAVKAGKSGAIGCLKREGDFNSLTIIEAL